MASGYTRQENLLERWRDGKIQPVAWRLCKLETCQERFPIFSGKSTISCCSKEHGELHRKAEQKKSAKRWSARARAKRTRKKNGIRAIEDLPRPPWINTLCKHPILGECDRYAEGFSINDVNAGCWGRKYHRSDNSCYVNSDYDDRGS